MDRQRDRERRRGTERDIGETVNGTETGGGRGTETGRGIERNRGTGRGTERQIYILDFVADGILHYRSCHWKNVSNQRTGMYISCCNGLTILLVHAPLPRPGILF